MRSCHFFLCLIVITTAGCLPDGPGDVPAEPARASLLPEPTRGGGDGEPDGAREAVVERPAGAPAEPRVVQVPPDRPAFQRPEHVRGVYLNAWTAGSSRRVEALLELARRTEVNAFVIDVKDASGYVSHASTVEAVRRSGATGQIRIPDLPGLLRRLEAEGVYPIARIVIVQDPLLAEARPDLAVQDAAGRTWVDGRGIVWLDPHQRGVWDYHVALAREVALLGFPEIQWDYVRFPDAPRSELARAVFPGADGRPKPRVIRDFMTYARERLADLDVLVAADVFGITTSAKDVGIGQVWEEFIDVVDVALPMVYPSHYYRRSFGHEVPNARPYEIVREALSRAVARSEGVPGAGRIVPWLQDFTLGEPRYGAPEVRAQIQGAYDAGVLEWVLWNPGSRYTEDALEPVGGFAAEPLIRVADGHVPVSRRHDALEAAGRAPTPGDGASGEGARTAGGEGVADPGAGPAGGTGSGSDGGERERPRVLDVDSLRGVLDTLQVLRDTLGLPPGGPAG